MIIIGITGCVLASFLYVVTQSKSIDFFYRRSKCPTCSKTLSFFELIPVVSYLVQRGKCMHCGSRISSTYFFAEILLLILFVMPLFFELQLSDLTLYYLLVSLMIPISVYDFETYTIPNHMTLLILISGAIITNLEHFNLVYDLLAITVLHLIFFLFNASIGYGDIKLFSVLAILTPLNFLVYTFLFTFIIGGFFILILFLIKSNLKEKIPLAPFITNSVIISFLLYEDLNILYFGGFT